MSRDAVAPAALEGSAASAAVRAMLVGGRECWVRATGRSMLPTLRPGDDVLLESMTGIAQPGDVVLAELHARLVVHRVVAASGDVIVMRGDASLDCDEPVHAAHVAARVIAAQRAGAVRPLRFTARFGIVALLRYLGDRARYGVSRAGRGAWLLARSRR